MSEKWMCLCTQMKILGLRRWGGGGLGAFTWRGASVSIYGNVHILLHYTDGQHYGETNFCWWLYICSNIYWSMGRANTELESFWLTDDFLIDSTQSSLSSAESTAKKWVPVGVPISACTGGRVRRRGEREERKEERMKEGRGGGGKGKRGERKPWSKRREEQACLYCHISQVPT